MAKKTISFVATGELAEWIEQEAERRMTTISTTTQQLLAEKYRAEQSQQEQAETDKGGSDRGELKERSDFEFEGKAVADAFRDRISDGFISEEDDKRLKTVTLAAGTPGEIIEEAENYAGKQADSSGDGE